LWGDSVQTEIIVGVDIGGTNIRVGAVDCNVNLMHEEMFSSRKLQGDTAVNNLLDYLKSYVKSMDSPVKAVSMGFPSTIDKERSTVINTPNLRGFDNVQITAIYQQALGIPVFISKDATMLLYYDLHKLNAKQSVVAGIYFGTGIGNSIIIDGKEFAGNDGVACELGHIPVSGRDDLCGCGLRGCIELYAGGKGLERIQASSFPDTPMEKLFTNHSSSPQLQTFISEMANAVVTEINIVNPGCIVVGGGVVQMEAFPKEQLRRTILEKTRSPIPRDTIEIFFSDAENPYNGVVGAALYASKNLNELHRAQAHGAPHGRGGV